MDNLYEYSNYALKSPDRAAAISTGAMATLSAGALLLAFGLALMFPVRDMVRHRHDARLVIEDGIAPNARRETLPPRTATIFVKDRDTFYHWHRDCKLLYFQSRQGHHWKIQSEPRAVADKQGKIPCFYCQELDRMEREGAGD